MATAIKIKAITGDIDPIAGTTVLTMFYDYVDGTVLNGTKTVTLANPIADLGLEISNIMDDNEFTDATL